MAGLPSFVVSGSRSMLFPVVADTSREARAVSIFLSCLEHVPEFGRSLLAEFGVKVNKRSNIETWTEVSLRKSGQKALRPDGLIVVKNGDLSWSALIEAKIGLSELTSEQVEAYLDLAKLNGVDALITISNQFAPLPGQHPLVLSQSSLKKSTLKHWSWYELMTKADLLLGDTGVVDGVQHQILTQLSRFLANPSSGVQSFDTMPQGWTELVDLIQSRSPITTRLLEVQDVVFAWHQKSQDIAFRLSRQIGSAVKVKVPKAHATDGFERTRSDAGNLVQSHCVQTSYVVSGAASPVTVACDFARKAIYFSMEVDAPEDKKSTKARVNWLLRQLSDVPPQNLFIRIHWPNKTPYTQFPIETLRNAPEVAELSGKTASCFEVIYAETIGSKFSKRKIICTEIEKVASFYDSVGRFLRKWNPPKQRINEPPFMEAIVCGGPINQPEFPAELVQDLEVRSLATLSPPVNFDEVQTRIFNRIKEAYVIGIIPDFSEQQMEKLISYRLPFLLNKQSEYLASEIARLKLENC